MIEKINKNKIVAEAALWALLIAIAVVIVCVVFWDRGWLNVIRFAIAWIIAFAVLMHFRRTITVTKHHVFDVLSTQKKITKTQILDRLRDGLDIYGWWRIDEYALSILLMELTDEGDLEAAHQYGESDRPLAYIRKFKLTEELEA